MGLILGSLVDPVFVWSVVVQMSMRKVSEWLRGSSLVVSVLGRKNLAVILDVCDLGISSGSCGCVVSGSPDVYEKGEWLRGSSLVVSVLGRKHLSVILDGCYFGISGGSCGCGQC